MACFSPVWSDLPRQRAEIVKGLLFGLFGLISMTVPFQVTPGVFVDARIIVICIAGIYGGTLPALLAALMVGMVRWGIGGVGVPGALVSIITATVIGLWVRRDHQARATKPRALLLLSIGVLLALAATSWGVLISRIDFSVMRQDALDDYCSLSAESAAAGSVNRQPGNEPRQ